MKISFLAMIMGMSIIFVANDLCAKNSDPVIPHFKTKCFVPLDVDIDSEHNVFAFFRNAIIDDLRLMPYHYWSLEVYGKDRKQADMIYHKLNDQKTPSSIHEVLEYLHNMNFICHAQGKSQKWPFIAYYSCIHKSEVPSKVVQHFK